MSEQKVAPAEKFTLQELREKYSIETLRMMELFRRYKEERGKKLATPTSYNLQNMCNHKHSIATISSWLRGAEKAGVVYQNHWYLDAPTYKLTAEGKQLLRDMDGVEILL